MGLLSFAKHLFSEVPPDYQGPETNWHVVPNYSQFTYSAVEGDFRVYPLARGFVAAWSDFLQARDEAGRPRWRADATGHAVALCPAGRQLLSFSAQTYRVVRLDAYTGQVLETFTLPDPTCYPSQLLWLPGGRLLVLTTGAVAVLGADRSAWLACYDTFAPTPEYGVQLQGMAWWPERPDELLLADHGGGRLLRLCLHTGQVVQQVPATWPSLYPGPAGRQALVYVPHEYLRLDPATLAVAQRYPFRGLEGVRTEAENYHQNSCTLWEKRAALSPDGKYLLAVDSSGLVWLFDAADGYQLRIFRRELVNYAYDVAWLDDRFFVALCNRGHVVKIDVTQLDGVFDVPDFMAHDDERHLPSAAAAKSMRTAATAAEVRAALDTLAETPDVATYAAAWETIHYAPADFEWDAALTPAHLAGVMRQYLWYLPDAKFSRLRDFADLRQQLAALHYFVAEAPVAPVLALHDELFLCHTYCPREAEHHCQALEGQLLHAYQSLHNWLLIHEPDDETGRPYTSTAPYEQFVAALERAADFLAHIQSDYGWEAHPVLERAFPRLAADYERLVVAQNPAAQLQLLRPAQYHAEPTAAALLRRLAQTSPHPDVRAFAVNSLSYGKL